MSQALRDTVPTTPAPEGSSRATRPWTGGTGRTSFPLGEGRGWGSKLGASCVKLRLIPAPAGDRDIIAALLTKTRAAN
jgi:hypothetical protein